MIEDGKDNDEVGDNGSVTIIILITSFSSSHVACRMLHAGKRKRKRKRSAGSGASALVGGIAINEITTFLVEAEARMRKRWKRH